MIPSLMRRNDNRYNKHYVLNVMKNLSVGLLSVGRAFGGTRITA